jgi:hypothetical protein
LNTLRKTLNTKNTAAFEDTALAVKCDEFEEWFDVALRKIAAHKPERAKPSAHG